MVGVLVFTIQNLEKEGFLCYCIFKLSIYLTKKINSVFIRILMPKGTVVASLYFISPPSFQHTFCIFETGITVWLWLV